MIENDISAFAEKFEDFLDSTVIPADGESYTGHYDAMRYSLLSGGKRLRPYIMGIFYEAAGGNNCGFYNFAAALEMIHSYSLIHDDLPCMDNDDLRRGRPSCHKAFDEATALLAGDGLLTRAFGLAATPVDGIPCEKSLRAVGVLSDLAGCDGMIGGQIIDLAIENKEAELDTVLRMYKKKTGALLCAAAAIGTMLGGGDETLISAAKNYALNLGIAFQIQDDILDIVGDAVLLGKPVGSDSQNHKSTYVSIVGLDQAKNDVLFYTAEAKKAMLPFGNAGTKALQLAEYLIERKY